MVLQAPALRPPVTMKSQGTVWSLSVPERYCRSVVWAETPAGAVRIKAVKRSLAGRRTVHLPVTGAS